jgi:hypothetical protein
MHSIPHSVAAVQSSSSHPHHAAAVLEAGSLPTFLALLGAARTPQTVLLMPIERTIPQTLRSIRQWAVQVTARLTPHQAHSTNPILYATFPAAECTLLGQSASLFFPQEQHGCASSLAAVAHAVQVELLACLVDVLEQQAVVQRVHVPARYRMPDEWVWVTSELQGSGITFQHGHWTCHMAQGTVPRGDTSSSLMQPVKPAEKVVLR